MVLKYEYQYKNLNGFIKNLWARKQKCVKNDRMGMP